MHNNLEGEINYNWPKSKEESAQVGAKFVNGIVEVCIKYNDSNGEVSCLHEKGFN